jgi:NADH-quinone oxidoreductase subunit N
LQSTFHISEVHFLEFLPETIFLVGLLALLLFSAFLRVKYTRRVTTLVVYLYALLLLVVVLFLIVFSGLNKGAYIFNFSLIIDYYTQSLKVIIISFALILLFVSKNFLLKSIKKDVVEYLLLICFSLFMMFILISSINIITTFIALEGLTMIIYILSIFPFVRYNFEATIKYFYLSALASSILLYGCSLIYGLTGSLNFIMIKYYIYRDLLVDPSNPTLQIIIVSLIFGMLFKIGAFPLH